MSQEPASATTRPYFRTPALSPDGRQVAFVYASDIWLADTAGGEAQRLTAHPASHFHPRFSPDGTQIAFTSNRSGGDVYVLPLNGGDVRRLTFHDTFSAVEDWSADGQYIYFSSWRNQQSSAIYRVPLTGGTPLEVLAEPYEGLTHLHVSPDGHTLALNNTRTAWWRRGPNPYGGSDIWLAPATPMQHQEGVPAIRKFSSYTGMNRWPLWAPDGRGIYFVSDRDSNGIENIWYQQLESGELRQVTHFTDGRVLWPAIARSANVLVFERNFDLWRLDLVTGEAAPITLRVRADTRISPVRVETHSRVGELTLAPDGKKLAFVARGEVFADFADKETDREQRQGPSFRITNSPFRERQVAWSPDSRRLVYVSDRHGEDELYLYDFPSHAETRLTEAPAPKAAPCFSPDGKWIAFVHSNDEIRLLNVETREVRPFVQGNFISSTALAWSPDSRWLAYLSHDDHFFTNVYVQQIDERTPHQVTFLSNLSGDALLWSPNGRFLIFTSSQYRDELQVARVDLRPTTPIFREAEFEKLFEEKRDRAPVVAERADGRADERESKQAAAGQAEKAPLEEVKEQSPPTDLPTPPVDVPATPDAPPATLEPTEPERREQKAAPNQVEIVFEGIERRLRLLTPIQMDAVAQDISHDSRDLLVTATVADKVNIWSLPLDEPRQEQPPRQLTYSTSSKSAVQFAPDGKSFYFLDDGQIVIRKFPNGNDPVTIPVRADVVVDFNQEKRQMFGEAWRLLRDSFYDETFRGQDWNAVRERYAPAVDGAQTNGDLHTILNLMLGELRASHLGVGFTGGGGQDGYTGLLFAPVELAANGALRIAAVVPDSPATRAVDASGSGGPPRVGEYLLAVDGTPLGPQISLDMLLQRSVGRRVLLRLGEEAGSGQTREIALRPVDANQYHRLRYRAWVAANESYVHRVSEGRLGYVHIEQMSYPAYQQFLADLDTEAHGKEGVVVDVRYNGGGHTATFILDVLARPSVLRSGFRSRSSVDAGHLAGNRVLGKPTVLVTNEHSGSNTEMLSESYRRLGLGPIVGKPTAGAVIWTWSMRLLDGATLRLPRMSITTPEGEDLEGTGRPVDIDVERPLGEWARDIDRQLDAAVHALLERLNNVEAPPAPLLGLR